MTPEPENRQQTPQQVVESWVATMVRHHVERLDPGQHAADVAALVDRLDTAPPPTDPARAAALRRERRELCRRVCRWCPSPERLARWLARVAGLYGVTNLGGYLRRAVDRGGDPGTVLEGRTRARAGRGAETWADFSAQTETRLEGAYCAATAQLVAGATAVLAAPDRHTRARLRLELRTLLEMGRTDGARRVLLQLVGAEPSVDALADAVRGILDLEAARRLLAA